MIKQYKLIQDVTPLVWEREREREDRRSGLCDFLPELSLAVEISPKNSLINQRPSRLASRCSAATVPHDAQQFALISAASCQTARLHQTHRSTGSSPQAARAPLFKRTTWKLGFKHRNTTTLVRSGSRNFAVSSELTRSVMLLPRFVRELLTSRRDFSFSSGSDAL